MRFDDRGIMNPVSNSALAEIGAAIREARQSYDLTQQDLADLLGVSDRTLRNLEKGDGSVAFGTVLAALQAVGLKWSLS